MAEENQNLCIICQDDIHGGVNTNCNHNFCGVCMLAWLTGADPLNLERLKCPTCRTVVTHLQPDVEEGEVANLSAMYNELYGHFPDMPDNEDELLGALLTSTRDLLIANGQPVNDIDGILDAIVHPPQPVPAMDLFDPPIGRGRMFAIGIVSAGFAMLSMYMQQMARRNA